ncbi:hypothetical protein PK98_09465 [Croceibacterium mercuriale]|uniref:PASTA domain-containing protein n=1 Tax=Croceibacterium mercuriale TaxID=1572751 RepID=A0A0B2C3H7_9SPHN|nr:hypothetical protein [Croceibacterium mercuriale]KHL26586.1 hypothetical protein PK98_09465 [Croceibacterium mercuriale]
MPNELSDFLGETVATPLGDVIAAVGQGVAAAQEALDRGSLEQTLELYRDGGDEMIALLREIGYRPTFYALPETIGEVTVAMRISGAGMQGQAAAAAVPPVLNPSLLASARIANISRVAVRKLPTTYVTPVDASFQNRYNYSATASSKITFKIVPVPAPGRVDELRVIPSLMNTTLGVARSLALSLDIAIQVVDAEGTEVAQPDETRPIAEQEPEAGTIMTGDATVNVTLKPDG